MFRPFFAGVVFVFTTAAGADVVSRVQSQLHTHLPAVEKANGVRIAATDDGALVAARTDRDEPLRLRLKYPQHYSGAFVAEQGTQRIALRATGARAAAARAEGGKLFYEDAYPGVDAVQVPSDARSEEILLLREKGAPLVYEYTITEMTGVRDIVLRDGAVHFLPVDIERRAQGFVTPPPALAIARPWVIDASGRKSESAARWELANSGTLTLRLIVNDAGLVYPLLVDPSFELVEMALITPRYRHSATLLHDGRVLLAGGYGGSGSRTATAEIFNRSTGFSATASMAVARSSHTATALRDGRVLIAGGAGNLCELYTLNGAFTAANSMIASRNNHTATLLSDGRVLIVGGKGGPDDGQSATSPQLTAEIFDPANDAFTATGNMAAAREGHTATLLPNGKVLVLGGYSIGQPGALATAELYDPAIGTFSSTGSMTTGRARPATTLMPNGLVLVFGGSGTPSTAELYNPATGTFTAINSSVPTISGPGATLLPNGKVLIAGTNDLSNAGRATLYDPATGLFGSTTTTESVRLLPHLTTLPGGDVLITGGAGGGSTAELYLSDAPTFLGVGAMTAARSAHTATILPNGKVLLAGGTGSGTALASAEEFNPATNGFTAVGAMANARSGQTATLLTNGRVLVAGGGTATAELYDPATQTFAPTGSLTGPARVSHAATLLDDGRVLITGGIYSFGGLTRAEIYDPATGQFTLTGLMSSVRSNHAAVLLRTGRVLVVGGHAAATSAELYNPDTGTWSATGSMDWPRKGAVAAMLPDGRVYVTGGDESGTAPAEIYNPITGTFSPFDNDFIFEDPGTHRVTATNDGRVLLTGVGVMNAFVADPATGLHTTHGTMLLLRTSHTSTLLGDGRVLIAGGVSNGSPTGIAEVLVPGVVNAAMQPVVSSAPAVVCQPAPLLVTGTNFFGVSSGSTGVTWDSAAHLPLLRMQRIDSDYVTYRRPISRTPTSFQSASFSGLPFGHYRVSIFSTGSASMER